MPVTSKENSTSNNLAVLLIGICGLHDKTQFQSKKFKNTSSLLNFYVESLLIRTSLVVFPLAESPLLQGVGDLSHR